MKEKILITGSTGFIGKYVLDLLKSDYEIIELTEDIFSVNWDMYMSTVKPTYLINLAWRTGKGYLDDYENVLFLRAGLDIYNSFYKYGGKRAVFIGTEQEYKRQDKSLKEDDEICPISLYAECKADLGKVLVKNSLIENKGFIWLRLFFIYGYGEKEQRLMPSIINAMLNNKDVTCSSDKYIRDYIYVKDVAQAIVTCLFSDYIGYVNVAGGEKTTIGEIAKQIKDITGSTSNIFFKEDDGQPATIWGDISLLKSLGWQKKYSLYDGLKEEIELMKGKK